MVSISACHAEDPGSIPGRGAFFSFYIIFYSLVMYSTSFFVQADCILLVGLAEKTLSESMTQVMPSRHALYLYIDSIQYFSP